MDIGAVGGSGSDWRLLLQPERSSFAKPADHAAADSGADAQPRVRPASESTAGDAVKSRQCRTCAERKYKDVSDDPSVSFQTPTSVAPEQAAAAVAAHEQEHVANNAARAEREGETAQSSVVIHTAVCPECGRAYVSGGTTTTTYSKKADTNTEQPERGLLIDATA
jgi:hypothetical protein